ncbi:t-snare coiled-coil domain family [Nannochloropsis oceanica]
MAAQDPFFAAREELRGKADYIHARHEKLLRLLKATNTASDPGFKALYACLYRDVEAADRQCNELEKVVALVENHRQRFRHIDNNELAERRAFVTRTKQSLVKVWNNLKSDHVKGKMSNDERDFQRSRPYDGSAMGHPTAAGRGGVGGGANGAFIDEQRSRQHLMLQEQDQGLEELGTAVDRVGRMADAMNQELNAQNRMLGDLEVEVENTNEQMNFVMGRLSKLLKTKDKYQLWLIIFLTVVLIVLIILTIYV